MTCKISHMYERWTACWSTVINNIDFNVTFFPSYLFSIVSPPFVGMQHFDEVEQYVENAKKNERGR